MLHGYKPIEYEKIPDDFEQNKHFIKQSDPEEKDNEIYVGIEIGELELEDDEEYDEDVL